MRTHTTTTLRQLIMDYLQPESPEMRKEEAQTILLSLPQIEADMYKTMEHLTGFWIDQSAAARIIQQIQRESVNLLNKLAKLPEMSGTKFQIEQNIASCLGNILHKISTTYKKLMDHSLAIPAYNRAKIDERVSKNMAKINIILKQKKIMPELALAICKCMIDLLARKRLAYQTLRYVENLQRELLIPQVISVYGNYWLCWRVYRLQYNSIEFLAVFEKVIAENFEEAKYPLEMYGTLWREFSRKPSQKTGDSYDPGARTCQSRMLDYIDSQLTKGR